MGTVPQAFRFACVAAKGGEVHLEQHRINQQSNERSDGDIDV